MVGTCGDYNAITADCGLDLGIGLRDCAKLNVMKIVGALCHPLFRNKKSMIASGLCIEKQYDSGRKELIKCIAHFLEGPTAMNEVTITSKGMYHQFTEWSSEESDDNAISVSPAMELAQKEFETFEKYSKTRFLPVMEKTKTLGTYDDTGNPKKEPILWIGKVICKGADLPLEGIVLITLMQKANMILPSTCRTTKKFSLGQAVTGTLAPHITTEVDCESLFSQAGHAAHPNHNRTVAETLEPLVMGKHRLLRIYCSQNKIKKEFLERWKKTAWSKKEDRDNVEFWEQQKEEY
eukprot:CCRYP_007840-RA/>CCRYP_007840-RA protein AED:0.04 eAED:0.11 QI:0/0/0/0.66/1/1/3/0/292